MSNENLTGYPSIDKPWLKYYSEAAINAELPQCTIYETLSSTNLNHPDDIALEYFGNKINYSMLFSNIEAAKRAFVNYGVKKGDKVIIFASSTPEIVYTVFALCRIGAVANMINPLFDKPQIIDRINETGAAVMIVLDQLYNNISDVIGQTCVKKSIIVPIYNSMPRLKRTVAKPKLNIGISYNDSVEEWDTFISNGKNTRETEDAEYVKDTPVIMVYSSGTTGASKGIVLTNDEVNATIAHYVFSDFAYERGNTFLQMIPIWFSTGIVLSLLMPICLGFTAILEPVFSKESFAADLKKYKPNMALTATSLWLYAATCRELRNVDLSSMTFPITGGEQILPKTEIQLNNFLSRHNCKSKLLKGYGMCELGSTISTDNSKYNKPGADGFPILGVTVAAFDVDTNEEKRYNEHGELRVISKSRMKEYFKNPSATDDFFWTDKNGSIWGCTGDMGYVDEDGFIHILGRCSDNFISQTGRKVYCFDIENVILQNPTVAQCKVIGIDSGKGFSIPAAQIIIESDNRISEQELLKEIHESCVDNLDADCVPCGYKIIEAFPVKNNGKRDMELIRQDKTGYVKPTDTGLAKVDFN